MSAQMILSQEGNIIKKIYLNLENEFENIKLHQFVIMPNHIHGIIEITKRADTGPAPTIGDVICSFKTRTTSLISKEVKNGTIEAYDKKIWQRNYYEHIIRNEQELYQIIKYIEDNPEKWNEDNYYKE